MLLGSITSVMYQRKSQNPLVFIFRSWFYLSSRTKQAFYYSLIYPYIAYCNCAWSSTCVFILKKVFYLQKHAAPAITNSDYRAHSAPSLICEIRDHVIFQINSFHTFIFLFYYQNQLLPSMFFNLFETTRQVLISVLE